MYFVCRMRGVVAGSSDGTKVLVKWTELDDNWGMLVTNLSQKVCDALD